ncbi:MAG: hypothetical protein M3065_21255 [Actinomycetota bacterium]|nr:hypothetical protein [Actinomycetota bacterium]
MRRINLPIALFAALIIPIGGLAAAAPAMAYNVGAVYKDCENNGQLTGHYSQAQLKAALNQLPAQVSEYSACADVIKQTLVRASSQSGGHGANSKGPITGAGGGRGGNGGSGGSGNTATGGDHGGKGGTSPANSAGTGSNGTGAVSLGGSNVRPGSTGSGASSSLPAAGIVVLILLALTAVSGGAVAIRRRVVARHST